MVTKHFLGNFKTENYESPLDEFSMPRNSWDAIC
jgi:hypothetical protein